MPNAGAPPSYPAEIAPALHGGIGNGNLLYSGVNRGPFLYGTDLYIVLVETPDVYPNEAYAAVYRSTNGGLTWAEADAGNRKAITAVDSGAPWYGDSFPYGVHRSGDTLYVCHSRQIAIEQFSMQSNAWGTQVASGGPETFESFGKDVGGFQARQFLVKRSDGSFVVLYQAQPKQPLAGYYLPVVMYTIWDGNNWASPVAPNPSLGTYRGEGAAGVTLGENDRAHLFWISDDYEDPAGKWHWRPYHAAVDSGDTLQALQMMGAAAGWYVDYSGNTGWDLEYPHVGVPKLINGLLVVPVLRKNISDGERSLCVCVGDPVDEPTWAEEIVPATQAGSYPLNNPQPLYYPAASDPGVAVSVCAVDGDLWAVFRSGNGSPYGFSFIGYSKRTAAGTWDAFPTSLYESYKTLTIEAEQISGESVGIAFSAEVELDSPFTGYAHYFHLPAPVAPGAVGPTLRNQAY